jgi:UPF0755 protein
MQSRLILRLTLYLVVPLAIAFLAYRFVNSYLVEPIDDKNKTQVLVDIEPASTFKSICHKMAEQRLIRHWRVLDIIGRLKGKSVKIKAGEYAFTPSMTPTEIFLHLTKGAEFKRELIVKPGMNIYSIAYSIQAAGINQANNFVAFAHDTELLVRAGLQTKSFEGYFAPGKYYFSKKMNIKNVIWELFSNSDKVWTADYQQKAQELNMSRNEILTIASLLQTEVAIPKQYFLFSGLIYNRLRAQRKLELESTLRYSLRNYTGQISDPMKSNRSPFNTFHDLGLPPTPICIPSKLAIEAALNPKPSSFMEFSRLENGVLVFK